MKMYMSEVSKFKISFLKVKPLMILPSFLKQINKNMVRHHFVGKKLHIPLYYIINHQN